MDSILSKLHDLQDYPMGSQNSLRDFLRVRLVCKAWRAACADHTGVATVCTGDSTDLDRLCKLLPRLAGLIIHYSPEFSLSPLSGFSGLSSLRLRPMNDIDVDDEQDEEEIDSGPLLDLSPIPSSVKTLALDTCNVQPACHQHIQCRGLTRLLYFWNSFRQMPRRLWKE